MQMRMKISNKNIIFKRRQLMHLAGSFQSLFSS